MTSQTPGRPLSTELRRTHGEQGHILGSYLTRVLRTARIGNVEIVVYDERMKCDEVMNFSVFSCCFFFVGNEAVKPCVTFMAKKNCQ